MQGFQKPGYPPQSPPAQYVHYSASSNYPPQMPYNTNTPPQMPPNPTGSYPGQYFPPSTQHYPSTETPVVPVVKGLEFSTESIRKAFIRKVYSILMIQLLITLGFVVLFTYHLGVRQFAIVNIEISLAALIIGIAVFISLMCCESVRHTWPTNLILLFVFTFAWSYIIGFVTTVADPEVVLMAVGLTTLVVVSLTIFAIQTKWDFTVCGGLLFVAGIVFVVVSLILSLTEFGRNNTVNLVVSSFGVLLFAVYLIYDTQLIVGGERKNTLTPEEYITGAIVLYLDIINIFLHILKILMALKQN